MPVRYIDVTQPSAMKEEARNLARAQLRKVFGIAGCFLLLHLAFAGVTFFNEFVRENWVTAYLPMAEGDYFHFVWWYFAYFPAFVFFYGFFELWPYLRLYQDRKKLEEATIIIMPRRVNTLFMMHTAGVLLLVLATALTLASDDAFASQLVLLISWGSYARIGGMIGTRI